MGQRDRLQVAMEICSSGQAEGPNCSSRGSRPRICPGIIFHMQHAPNRPRPSGVQKDLQHGNHLGVRSTTQPWRLSYAGSAMLRAWIWIPVRRRQCTCMWDEIAHSEDIPTRSSRARKWSWVNVGRRILHLPVGVRGTFEVSRWEGNLGVLQSLLNIF